MDQHKDGLDWRTFCNEVLLFVYFLTPNETEVHRKNFSCYLK